MTPGVSVAMSLLPGRMDTREARVMLHAIGVQESRLEFRRQHGNGPARGLWQFERGGGVKGVLEHDASRYWAFALCEVRKVKPQAMAVWRALERDDVLAAGFARLLLFTDPKRLPALDDVQGAWRYYHRNWRPGKPHPAAWPANHAAALEDA